jgi:hypothetical protein
VLALFTKPATAASLFSFGTDFSHPGAGAANPCASNTKCDIALNRVAVGNQNLDVGQLLRVTDAALVSNYTGGASLDKGDWAAGTSQYLQQEADEVLKPQFNTSSDELGIVETLGNHQQPIFNLNNMINTEDSGQGNSSAEDGVFTVDLLFGSGASFDTLLFWERGQDSDLRLKPIYEVAGNQATSVGQEIAISAIEWDDAGYSTDTAESNGAEAVGSKGVYFGSLIQGVRVMTSKELAAADFKVAAAKTGKRTVPEPGTVAGIALSGALMVASRRRQVKKEGK